jgi:uncharacterized metal-binding protein YceD (DUF177 family)
MEYELSRPIIVDELPSHGKKIDLSPTADELNAIAKRLDLVTLDVLSGNIAIRPEMGREISAEGKITAEFVQNCVVTGDPVAQAITFDLVRRYSEDASEFDDLSDDDDIVGNPMDEGTDPIEGGGIDVGEATVEELALQIPAYPRAPGAEFSDIVDDIKDVELKPNPFAKLAALKKDLESDN